MRSLLFITAVYKQTVLSSVLFLTFSLCFSVGKKFVSTLSFSPKTLARVFALGP